MEFLVGLIVGAIVSGTVSAIVVGTMMAAKRADRDYESELNEPQSRRVDRQGR
jgi:hypothetical protein